jgi:hypothetical protein
MASEVFQPEIQESSRERVLPVSAGNREPASTKPEEHPALFPAGEADDLRARWREVQGAFVDEPRQAVEKANELVECVIKRLTDGFAQERATLEKEWSAGNDVSTEDLRQALRHYRSFFDRLLSV